MPTKIIGNGINNKEYGMKIEDISWDMNENQEESKRIVSIILPELIIKSKNVNEEQSKAKNTLEMVKSNITAAVANYSSIPLEIAKIGLIFVFINPAFTSIFNSFLPKVPNVFYYLIKSVLLLCSLLLLNLLFKSVSEKKKNEYILLT